MPPNKAMKLTSALGSRGVADFGFGRSPSARPRGVRALAAYRRCSADFRGEMNMTPRTLFRVVTGLFALWCGVTAISALASAPALDWGEPGEFRQVQAMSVASLVIVPIIFGLLLWFGSEWLAGHAAAEGGAEAAAPLDAAQLFALGTSLLGLVVVVQVLPEFAQAGTFAIAARFMPNPDEPMDGSFELQRWVYRQAGIARMVSLTARLTLGVVLLLGPKHVWRSIRQFADRTFGSRVPDEDREE